MPRKNKQPRLSTAKDVLCSSGQVSSYDIINTIPDARTKSYPGETNDCVVRALAMVSKKVSYDNAHEFCRQFLDRKHRRGVINTGVKLTELTNSPKVKHMVNLLGVKVVEGILSQKTAVKYSYQDGYTAINENYPESSCYFRMTHNIKNKVKMDVIGNHRYNKPFDATSPTVSSFAESHPKGKWIVLVRGHALAVIDGVVVDNTVKVGGDKRPVRMAFRVEDV